MQWIFPPGGAIIFQVTSNILLEEKVWKLISKNFEQSAMFCYDMGPKFFVTWLNNALKNL